ncbi:MAG: hypothetical protein JRJ44_03960 [Deltaproteobacteria bacterium]|nr:hypothetical protein [Deltaproteobacteria bacterium]
MFTYTLFAKPSFISGMASSIDLGATLSGYNYDALPPEIADRLAVISDWAAVGSDMFCALENYEEIEKISSDNS